MWKRNRKVDSIFLYAVPLTMCFFGILIMISSVFLVIATIRALSWFFGGFILFFVGILIAALLDSFLIGGWLCGEFSFITRLEGTYG